MKNIQKKIPILRLIILILLFSLSGCQVEPPINREIAHVLSETANSQLTYYLSPPETGGGISVEEALMNRRSQRNFQSKELSEEHLSQILWAAYGITEPMPDNPPPGGGLRTSPSAGALYPLEIYVAAGNVAGIESGVYKYIPGEHMIVRVVDRDVREELSAASLSQAMLKDAAITVIYTAVFDRVEARYGQRGRERYVFMEIGHSAQNIYLQAESLGLGTCAIGAFTDSALSSLLMLPSDEEPLYLMPVGHIRE